MAQIKSLSRISNKWKTVTPQRQSEYIEGVSNPRADWKTQTLKAAPMYERGLQQSIANKSFDKGVNSAGTAKWQENALTKGPGRWAEGVGLGQGNYEVGFSPYQAIIAGLTLPPRGPKGDPNNIARVAIIAKALHEAKKARGK
jgi:hypothetical protein